MTIKHEFKKDLEGMVVQIAVVIRVSLSNCLATTDIELSKKWPSVYRQQKVN